VVGVRVAPHLDVGTLNVEVQAGDRVAVSGAGDGTSPPNESLVVVMSPLLSLVALA
jgi:hypothetical protein